MAIVVLFGGGDAGGIKITSSGVEPIPPWEAALRLQLKALNALARSSSLLTPDKRTRHLDDVVNQLTTNVLTQVEAIVGELDTDNGLVFQDEDSGFSCGSSGRPPVSFPHPVDPRSTVLDILGRGVLDAQTLTFLEQAAMHKLDVFEVAADPRAAAQRMGVELSAEVERGLATLSLDPSAVEDAVSREVIDFYRKVVEDGRYVGQWVVDPGEVARKLGVEVSRDAIDRVIATRDSGVVFQSGDVSLMPAVAVAIAIVILTWTREADLPVIDRSGVAKL